MEKSQMRKHSTLEVISETEPTSYNNQRTNLHSQNAQHVQIPAKIYFEKSTNQLSSSSSDGHINQGFNVNSQNSIDREGSSPSGRVYREQYWICSQALRCRNWTKRERILFFVLLGLSSIVLGLVAVISFISRNTSNSSETPPGWLPWL